MSGHSKWATIKHKKGAADKARGKLFAKLIRQVEVAAREGGGDPDANPTLRTMFQKAREASVPLDTIERAIKRGTGELEGVRYEQVAYEGYAPSGVAVIVECLTDNRNRTGADIRSIFSKNGGSMAEPGAVSWQFERKGVIAGPEAGRRQRHRGRPHAGRPGRRGRGHHRRRRPLAGDHPAGRPAAVRAALEEAGIAVRLGRGHHGADHDGAARQRDRRQEGAAPDRPARGPRRRAERLRQLRHPRRHPRAGRG